METDSIDSNCFAPDRESDREESRCHDDAATYVLLPSGVRKYVCPEHFDDVERFGDVDDHPKAGICSRCRKLTPVDHIDHDGVCDDCKA